MPMLRHNHAYVEPRPCLPKCALLKKDKTASCPTLPHESLQSTYSLIDWYPFRLLSLFVKNCPLSHFKNIGSDMWVQMNFVKEHEMKTILLEVEENSYQTVLNFIKLLPENHCRIIDDDELSNEELHHVQNTLRQIQQGDYSEFEAWETVKNRL